MYSEQTIPDTSKTQSNGFSIKLIPVETENEESKSKELDSSSHSYQNKKRQELTNKMELGRRTDNGI